MPVAVADAAVKSRGHGRNVDAEGERKQHGRIDDFERYEIVLVVVAAVIKQKSVSFSGRKAVEDD